MQKMCKFISDNTPTEIIDLINEDERYNRAVILEQEARQSE